MNKQRAELHLHTAMSTMDGINVITEYINAAIYDKMPAIAITDHASAQAFPEAYNTMKKYHELDLNLKLIYGNEIYLVCDNSERADEISHKGKTNHASVLVVNKAGLKNLYKLISLANTEYFYKVPRTPKSELKKYREGLLIGSGCDCGELYHAIRDGKSNEELIEVALFYDYLEVVPVGNFRYYIEDGQVKTEEELKKINQKIIEIGDIIGKPVVAVSDAHYVHEEDAVCRKIIMHSKGFEEYNCQPDLSMRTTDEMLEEFAFLGEEKAYEIVVENTQKIADAVDDKIELFPQEREYPRIKNADERIEMWAYIGARKQYGNNIPSFVEERLEWELEKIKENGYADLYLIAMELVKSSKRKGYVVGNRGCIASSLVAYFLEITEINPVAPHYYCEKCGHYEVNDSVFCGCDLDDKLCPKCGEALSKDGFNIPAETFMGADGDKEPDIDFNFAPEIRDEAKKRLKELFGENRVICAGTVSSISEKIAHRYVQEYCNDMKIACSNDRADEYAEKLRNVKRTTGLHPGGSFIIPEGKDILDFTPIQYPANNTHYGITTTHFDFHDLQGCLFKFDLLMQDTSSMLRKLEQLTGVNPGTIPLCDKETMDLFSNAKTCGVPEFYTDFVKQMMKTIGVNSFDDLIRLSGLSHGTDVWIGNGEYDIQQDGVELSDLISTRDDITVYLERNGYDRKEAFKISERVRKGKGLTEEQEKEMHQKGISEWYIESCNTVKYLFPRAHAASYALLSYRIAYYKAHYPLEFCCAYFSINADRFDADLLINNADVLYEKINELKNSDDKYHKSYQLDMMEVCQEMYENGFEFVSEHIKNDTFESFFIENGKLRPKLKYN